MLYKLKGKTAPLGLAFSSHVHLLQGHLEGAHAVLDEKLYCFLDNILQCQTNGKDQLAHLKKICCHTKSLLTDMPDASLQALMDISCQMFVYCVQKHPFRRALISFWKNSNEIMSSSFTFHMTQIITHQSHLEHGTLTSKAWTDALQVLMQDFTLGANVIRSSFLLVMNDLLERLIASLQSISSEVNPETQANAMQDCLAIIKTILAVFSGDRCKVLDGEESVSYEAESGKTVAIFTRLFDLLLVIIPNSKYILECRKVAAMLLPAAIHVIDYIDSCEYIGMRLYALINNKGIVAKCDKDQYRGSSVTDVILHAISGLLATSSSTTVKVLLWHALMVKLPSVILHAKFNEQGTLFNSSFTDNIISECSASMEKSVLNLSFKTLELWLVEANRVCTDMKDIREDFQRCHLTVKDAVLPHLLSYIDHPVDAVRHSIKSSLNVCCTMMKLSDTCTLINLCEEYANGDLKSRGKLNALAALARHIKISQVLQMKEHLPAQLLEILNDIDISTHVGELYRFLAEEHFKEIKSDVDSWIVTWIQPIFDELLHENKEVEVVALKIILSGIFKLYPHILSIILKRSCIENQSDTLIDGQKAMYSSRHIIMLLMIAKSSNETKSLCERSIGEMSSSSGNNFLWKGFVPMPDMFNLLIHIDKQVSLDTLSLICDSLNTTDSVSVQDVALIKFFIQHNMQSQDASFQQNVLTSLKKVMMRMFAHAFQLNKKHRDSQSDAISDDFVQSYVGFLHWLTCACLDSIYISASHQQVAISLNLLSLIASIFQQFVDMQFIQFSEDVRLSCVHKLLLCFRLSFEPNSALALAILQHRPIFCGDLSLAEQTALREEAEERLIDKQPNVSSVAAYQLCYLALCAKIKGASAGVLDMLKELLLKVDAQLNVMRKSLLQAAQSAPMYGTLYAIRILFQVEQLSIGHPDVLRDKLDFMQLVQSLVQRSLEIIELVSPFVSSEAPEGSLCDASLAEVVVQLGYRGECLDVTMHARVARLLLMCSWRSMKEVSLLLGIIISNFTTSSSSSNPDDELVLQKHTLVDVWGMFCNILLRSKHAGTYELASIGFIKLCNVLWLSTDPDLSDLPLQAVKNLLCDITSVDLSSLAVTRRGAGVPFYINALCQTEPAIRSRALFNHAMTTLTETCVHLARSTDHDSKHVQLNQQVICLNILRAFYKDASLGDDVYPYISSGIEIAVHGFASAIWAIRNSSTLLFSALMQRIFGVNKFKMTGREFFCRFPSLYNFLLTEAEAMSSSSGETSAQSLHPSLFPVLLLLSRLYPSSIDGTDTSFGLCNFVDPVIRCANSAVWRTRVMSAQALVPLVPFDQLPVVIQKLFGLLPSQLNYQADMRKPIDENLLHGIFLQIRALLISNWKLVMASSLKETVYSSLMGVSWVLDEGNSSKSVFLALVENVLEVLDFTDDRTREFLSKCLEYCLCSLLEEHGGRNQAGSPLLKRSSISLICSMAYGSVPMQIALCNVVFKERFHDIAKDHVLLKSKESKLDATNLSAEDLKSLINCLLLYFVHSSDVEVYSTVLRKVEEEMDGFYLNALFGLLISESCLDSTRFCLILQTLSRLGVVYATGLNIDIHLKTWRMIHNYIVTKLCDPVALAVLSYIKYFFVDVDHCKDIIEVITPAVMSTTEEMFYFTCNASAPERYSEIRKQAALLLCHSPWNLAALFQQSTCVHRLYAQSAINLLLDESEEVREITARNVQQAIKQTYGGIEFSWDEDFQQLNNSHENHNLSPPVILTVFLNTYVSDLLHKDLTSTMFFLLCQLNRDVDMRWFLAEKGQCKKTLDMKSNSEIPSDTKFIVFEERKSNPYFDEFKLCSQICKCIYVFLTANPASVISLDDELIATIKEIYATSSGKDVVLNNLKCIGKCILKYL